MDMDLDDLNQICSQYNIGLPEGEPIRIYGGLLHKIWKVVTSKSIYAIKKLSRDVDISQAIIVENYELSEYLATEFKRHHIPAVHAIKSHGQYLYVTEEQKAYLVYPWVDGDVLPAQVTSEPHALKMAALIAKMHQLNLDIKGMNNPEYSIHSTEDLLGLIADAEEHKCSFSNYLSKKQGAILEANHAYAKSLALLKSHGVVSHADLDQKNVLWTVHQDPLIIDWESARKVNPTYEIVNASLDWSGISHSFNQELFFKMLQAYRNAGGVVDTSMVEASFYGVLGNWINWLAYNIERSFHSDDKEQRKLGTEQVKLVLPTILKVQQLIPELMGMKFS